MRLTRSSRQVSNFWTFLQMLRTNTSGSPTVILVGGARATWRQSQVHSRLVRSDLRTCPRKCAELTRVVHKIPGNKLWEWFSFGRYGTGGYDVRQQVSLCSLQWQYHTRCASLCKFYSNVFEPDLQVYIYYDMQLHAPLYMLQFTCWQPDVVACMHL